MTGAVPQPAVAEAADVAVFPAVLCACGVPGALQAVGRGENTQHGNRQRTATAMLSAYLN